MFAEAAPDARAARTGNHAAARLRRFGALMPLIERIARAAPFRHLVTPGGQTMSVAMTNCGPLGWVSDRSGYRYNPRDPLTGRHWPAMPAEFLRPGAGCGDARADSANSSRMPAW